MNWCKNNAFSHQFLPEFAFKGFFVAQDMSHLANLPSLFLPPSLFFFFTLSHREPGLTSIAENVFLSLSPTMHLEGTRPSLGLSQKLLAPLPWGEGGGRPWAVSLSLSSLSPSVTGCATNGLPLPELFSRRGLFCLCALQYSFIHVVLFFSFYFALPDSPLSFAPLLFFPIPFLTPSSGLPTCPPPHPRSSCMRLSSPPCRCHQGVSSTAEACPRRPTWAHTPHRPTHTHRATKAAAPLSPTRPR